MLALLALLTSASDSVAHSSLDVVSNALRLDLFGKLLLAILLGGAIGVERELAGKPAGLRTNILICLGSALIMDVSRSVMTVDGAHSGDPGRIAAQVISGIGFLGAGSILQARGAVLGLTTAATIWMVAAIGLTVGSGLYIEACGSTVLTVGVLYGLGTLEKKILAKRRVVSMTVRASPNTDYQELEGALRRTGVHVLSRTMFEHQEDTTYELKVVGPARQLDVATSELAKRPDVVSVQTD